MADIIELSATDLAAMLCSRVCHDLINPVGAIGNGLEVLADPTQAAMFDGVIKHDLVRNTSVVHRYGSNTVCGETVFTPNPSGTGEDDGWLLNFVHDLGADQSSLVVLDASTLEEAARVLIPRRVPLGFHGNFLASA